jgi:hypothetical protein
MLSLRSFKSKFFVLCLPIFALAGMFSPSLWCAEGNALRAGAAKVDITPKDLGGLWMVWAQPFDGVHDPIYARAVVVDNGVNSAAIVATDLVEFGDTTSLRERIQRAADSRNVICAGPALFQSGLHAICRQRYCGSSPEGQSRVAACSRRCGHWPCRHQCAA